MKETLIAKQSKTVDILESAYRRQTLDGARCGCTNEKKLFSYDLQSLERHAINRRIENSKSRRHFCVFAHHESSAAVAAFAA